MSASDKQLGQLSAGFPPDFVLMIAVFFLRSFWFVVQSKLGFAGFANHLCAARVPFFFVFVQGCEKFIRGEADVPLFETKRKRT